MTRSHTSAPANASARPAGRGRSPLVAAQVHPGLMHARTRQAVLVGMAVAALAAAGGVHAAESEAVPVSIEGKTFKVEAPVQTQVVTDSVARRVEAGTTANGAPVIVTRLSSRKKDPSADKAEENGQAQANKTVAGQVAQGAGQEAVTSGQDAGGAADTGNTGSTEASTAGADATSAGAENPEAGADGANGTGNAADAGITYKAKVEPKVVHTKAEDMEPFVIHAVTPHSVSMAWESDPSVVYNIARNGQPIAQVSGGKYVDETASPGTEYQYSIEPATEPADASGKPGMSGVIQVRTPDASGSGGVATKAPGLATKNMRAGGPTVTMYKRRTFIPDLQVIPDKMMALMTAAACPPHIGIFWGDGRDWSNDFFLSPDKSRTEITLMADWRRNPTVLESTIHVSATHVSAFYGPNEKRAKPNSGWLEDSYVDDDGSHATFKIHHDIGNPFCNLNSIYYKETVEMWNDGSVRISYGVRRKAPRHEALVMLRFPGENGDVYRGPWRLLQMENYGFGCLGWVNRCGEDEYEASHSL